MRMSSFPKDVELPTEEASGGDVEVATAESGNAVRNCNLSRKQWIYIAIGTLLVVAGVAAGLGAGLSGGGGSSSIDRSESSAVGGGSPTNDTVAQTPQPITLAPSVADGTTVTAPAPVASTAAPVASITPAPVASPPTSNSNALSASYRIIWIEDEDQGCNNREHMVTITCPFRMLFYEGNDCHAVNEEQNSITCSGFLRDTVDVGCVGSTADELLVDVDVSGSEHTCDENRREVSADERQFTEYAEGSASLVTTVIVKDCAEQSPLSCSGTFAVEVNTELLAGCGSRLQCSVSMTCFTDLPEFCFNLKCQGNLEGVGYAVTGISDQCVRGFDLNSLANGESCEYDLECISNVCSYLLCQEPLVDEVPCEESGDCLNRACAYKDASYSEQICCLNGQTIQSSSGETVCLGSAFANAKCDDKDSICQSIDCAYVDRNRDITVCCGSGSFPFQRSQYDLTQDDYCFNEATVGANCEGNVGNVCESGICAGGLCWAGPRDAGDVCDDDGDCQSGACGYIDRDRDITVCCGSGSFPFQRSQYDLTQDDYCFNEAPVGANCEGNIGNVCESGICAGGLCRAGPGGAGDVCDDDGDCQSGACGYIDRNRSSRVCCKGQETFPYQRSPSDLKKDDYCFNEAPAGANCEPNVGNVCESTICTNSRCE